MLVQNLRYTLRMLRRSPGFTAIAVATLALGIGANTAVFSVVDAVMLRPLPYSAPDRLISLWETNDRRQGVRSTVAPANLVDYVRDTRSFDGLAGVDTTSKSLTKAGPPEQLVGEAITWNLFNVLGVAPAIGRSFLPDDDRPGHEHVVILSDALWRSRFGADRSIVGRTITLNSEPCDVVGVMPPSFQPVSQIGTATTIAFFVPAAYPHELLQNHGDHEIRVVGRLKNGVTVQQAQADLLAVSTSLERQYPDTNTGTRARIAALSDDIVRNVRTSLLVLLGAVGFVLLVACVNLANLLIVRAIGQRHEMAIRMALGATRRQIAVDLMTRGLTLAALGGAAGLVCGLWTRDALIAMAPASIPRLGQLPISPRVMGVTAALAIASGLLAALLPAIQASRRESSATLRATDANASSSRAIMRWRGVLMAAEIAAALVLAIGAGLLVRSLIHLNAIELGFETDRVLTLLVRLPDSKYTTQRTRATFFETLAPRIRAIPGVRNVAFANQFPMRGGWGSGFSVVGGSGEMLEADFQAVSPDYFAALGMPLVRGRLIGGADRDGSAHVAVVSQTLVRDYLGDRDPIGQQITRGGPGAPAITIVGVVGEVRRDGKEAKLTPQVYLPAAQTDAYPVRLAAVAVRANSDPYALVASIQKAVWSIDPDQPITGVRTLDDVLAASTAQRRFNMTLLASFAGLAVALALIGVYGVITYSVAQRTREIGIRVALGATRADVVGLVVRAGMGWSLAGVAAGTVGALALNRVVSGLLFGVTANDPITFAATAAAMFAVAFMATYVPARRAASVDPIAALRAE